MKFIVVMNRLSTTVSIGKLHSTSPLQFCVVLPTGDGEYLYKTVSFMGLLISLLEELRYCIGRDSK